MNKLLSGTDGWVWLQVGWIGMSLGVITSGKNGCGFVWYELLSALKSEGCVQVERTCETSRGMDELGIGSSLKDGHNFKWDGMACPQVGQMGWMVGQLQAGQMSYKWKDGCGFRCRG